MIEQKNKSLARPRRAMPPLPRHSLPQPWRAARGANRCARWGQASVKSAPLRQKITDYFPRHTGTSNSSKCLLKSMLKRQTVRVYQSVENRLEIKKLIEEQKQVLKRLEGELAKAKRVSVRAVMRQETIKYYLGMPLSCGLLREVNM